MTPALPHPASGSPLSAVPDSLCPADVEAILHMSNWMWWAVHGDHAFAADEVPTAVSVADCAPVRRAG